MVRFDGARYPELSVHPLLSTYEASVAEEKDSVDFEGIYSCHYSSCLFSFFLINHTPFGTIVHSFTTLSFEFNQDSINTHSYLY